MDLIQLSEQLKGVQDQFLEQQVTNPSGTVPPYLVLSELNRRKTLRSQMAEPPVSTVAQDVLQQQPPMMPMQQGMGGVDMLNQQQPQPQMPQVPQGGMPMGGGLAAMAPPMQQGPPAPQRMAGGGLVGAGKDRVMGRPDGYWGDHARRMAVGGGVIYKSRPQMNVTRGPDGGWVYEIDGKQYPISGRAPTEFPKYEAQERISVPRPKLEEFLGEVQAITKDPEGYVSPLEKRISELEAQRAKIKRPNISQGLFETGLGMLASKAPSMTQALGEAAGGAFGNYMQRRDVADKTELGITDRLAGIAAQREEQDRRARMEELRAASELASRQYGANMVEAQLADAERNRERQHGLAQYQAEAAARNADLATERGLQGQIISGALREPEVSEYQKQLWDLEKIKATGDQHVRASAAAAARGYGGYGSRPIPQSEARSIAERLIREQSGIWGVGGEDTDVTFLNRLKGGLSKEVLSGKRFGEYQLHPRTREAIASELENWEPGKTDTKFSTGLAAYVKAGRDAELARGAAATPAAFGDKPASRGGHTKPYMTFHPEPPPAAEQPTRYDPTRPAWAGPAKTGLSGERFRYSDPGVPVRGTQLDQFLSYQPDDWEEYLRQVQRVR